jgi:thymidylate synthase
MKFDSLAGMWVSVVDDVLNQGESVDGTLEVRGFAATLTKPNNCLITNSIRQQSRAYLGAELAWYLSGSNKLEHLKLFAPSYINFSDDGGETAYGAYGLRGLSLKALADLAQRIREAPSSRQHVIPIWRLSDQGVKSLDVPCTVSLQFLLRNGVLDLSVYMRSNDLAKGFIYDIPCFCLIQTMMADMLQVKLGCYHHHVGSLHIYDRDVNKLSAAIRAATTSQMVSYFTIHNAGQLIDAFEGRPFLSDHTTVTFYDILKEVEKKRAGN